MIENLFARMEHPTAGYSSDQLLVEKLDPEEYYPVKRVSIGQSSTSVHLAEDPTSFNSVNLEFYKKDDFGVMTSYNIFFDPELNPYLKGVRGF